MAQTPEPPYYAVIFSSARTPGDDGYGDTAARMVSLASGQPSFRGVESACGADGLGNTVSYWQTLEAIAAWKSVAEHRAAQERGRKDWYAAYNVRIARVEKSYAFRR